MDSEPRTIFCCHVSCENEAEYEIIDLGDPRPDCAFTSSCVEHVGHLLGHLDGVPVGARDEWSVYPL